jgi:hypothetical protein
MAFHHHRTPGRQRRGRITTRHRKGERKVRRAKHRHRTRRHLHQAQVRARQGLTVGQRLIMAAVEIIALLDMVGKQAQLTDRPATLTIQARFWKACLLHAHRRDGLATRLDLKGNRAQERRPFTTAQRAVRLERLFSRFNRPTHQLRCANRKAIRPTRHGHVLKGLFRTRPGPSDEVLAV